MLQYNSFKLSHKISKHAFCKFFHACLKWWHVSMDHELRQNVSVSCCVVWACHVPSVVLKNSIDSLDISNLVKIFLDKTILIHSFNRNMSYISDLTLMHVFYFLS